MKDFTVGDFTRVVNDQVFDQVAENDKYLEFTSVEALLESIEAQANQTDVFYINRLICEQLDKDGEYAEYIAKKHNNDYSVITDRKANSIRNKFIRASINDNIGKGENHIILSKDTSIDINRVLIADSSSNIKYGLNGNRRGKIFAIALALNLDYEQMEYLLVYCMGERKINYKNPYEVILAYVLMKHVNVYETYRRLVEEFESMEASKKQINASSATIFFEEEFPKIDNEEELIKFLLTLPNTNSQGATAVFNKILEDIRTTVDPKRDYDKDFVITTENECREAIKKYEAEIDELNLELENLSEISDSDKINKIIEKIEYRNGKIVEKEEIIANEGWNYFINLCTTHRANTMEVMNWIYGGNLSKNTKLKKEMINRSNLNDITSGIVTPTKNQLVMLLFLQFCLTLAYTKFIEEKSESLTEEEKDSECDILSVEDIYFEFFDHCEDDLNEAGFDSIYMPNYFERFIVTCLLTEYPLETFKAVTSENE